jgi:hypothetical protein
VAIEIERISDAELERLAEQGGSLSVEAGIIEELRERRAKDRQVYAFRVGDYYFTGPVPDARTEMALIDLAEEASEA